MEAVIHHLYTTINVVILSGKRKYPRLKERSIKAKLKGFWGDWTFREKIANLHKSVCLPTPSVHT